MEKKTPSKYVGKKPNNEDYFKKWFKGLSDKEKIEYICYLERDTIRYYTKITLFFTLIFIVIIVLAILNTF